MNETSKAWWDIETAFYVNKRGVDPANARIFTILRWMYHGDFRPLAAAINDGTVLDEAILNLLAQMIIDDRLRLVARKGRRGRPKAPETLARNVVAALAYEADQYQSQEAFEKIAKALGTSEQTVRQAVTAWRKAERKLKNN